MKCRDCPYQVRRLRGGQYVHCWPQAAPPDGVVVNSPDWRAFTTEYGYELGLYTLRTLNHVAAPREQE